MRDRVRVASSDSQSANLEGNIMASIITLLAAIAGATTLMFVFAIYRRHMRAAKPSAFRNNNVVAFGSALLMTVALMASLAFDGFSVMPFVHSAFLSGLVAIGSHIAIWAIARSIIPLSPEIDANP
jgi:drug/metabolite transporter (DMT)-like permease